MVAVGLAPLKQMFDLSGSAAQRVGTGGMSDGLDEKMIQ